MSIVYCYILHVIIYVDKYLYFHYNIWEPISVKKLIDMFIDAVEFV